MRKTGYLYGSDFRFALHYLFGYSLIQIVNCKIEGIMTDTVRNSEPRAMKWIFRGGLLGLTLFAVWGLTVAVHSVRMAAKRSEGQ